MTTYPGNINPKFMCPKGKVVLTTNGSEYFPKIHNFLAGSP